MSRLRVKGLSKTFGQKVVLQDINLDIEPGATHIIIGGSGCGKSVLMKSICGLIIPDSGSEVYIDDVCYTQEPLQHREYFLDRFGMLFQGSALFDSMNVWQNIVFRVGRLRNLTRQQSRDLAVEKLELVGLDSGVLDKYPKELSGGMQKRAALARAIAHDPTMIFFDEPTTGLDPVMASIITDLMIDVGKKLSATILIITHDMSCVTKAADRISMLANTHKIWEGDSIASCDNKEVLDFVAGRHEKISHTA